MSEQFDFFNKLAKERLSQGRYEHCLGVSETSEFLARKYQVDVQKAKLAGLLHDFYKETPHQVFVNWIKENHYDQDLLNYGRGVWHGLIGADILKEEFDVCDEEILNAIRFHTVTDRRMDRLAKIIFVADYIEPHRKFKEAEIAREIVNQDLDAAVLYEINCSFKYLMENSMMIHPALLKTYNALYTSDVLNQNIIKKSEEFWKQTR